VAFKAVTACKQHRELLKAIAQALIICVAMAMVTLISTLPFDLFRSAILISRKLSLSPHMPSNHSINYSYPLNTSVTWSCRSLDILRQCPFALRKQAASLQTVRSIGLVKDGILYCSSIFGYRDVPSINCSPHYRQQTSHDAFHRSVALKNSPVMIMWYPAATDGQSGIIEVVNIDLLSNLMLEPDEPLITSASLSMETDICLW
jgi:hypothetical protein